MLFEENEEEEKKKKEKFIKMNLSLSWCLVKNVVLKYTKKRCLLFCALKAF